MAQAGSHSLGSRDWPGLVQASVRKLLFPHSLRWWLAGFCSSLAVHQRPPWPHGPFHRTARNTAAGSVSMSEQPENRWEQEESPVFRHLVLDMKAQDSPSFSLIPLDTGMPLGPTNLPEGRGMHQDSKSRRLFLTQLSTTLLSQMLNLHDQPPPQEYLILFSLLPFRIEHPWSQELRIPTE